MVHSGGMAMPSAVRNQHSHAQTRTVHTRRRGRHRHNRHRVSNCRTDRRSTSRVGEVALLADWVGWVA